MKDWKKLKSELMKNPEFRKEYKESELEFNIAQTIIRARIEKGYTQKQLAEKLHTKQSVISRVESAKTTPTLSFLKRIATALNANLKVQIT